SERPARALLVAWMESSALLGLVAGGLFGVSAVGFRPAAGSLHPPSAFLPAALPPPMFSLLPTPPLGGSLPPPPRGEPARASAGALVGAASSLGSAGWFTAFPLQIAASVRTLGLVELPATLVISLYAFRERPSRAEILGLALLGVSIAMVLNGGR